jgi:para-nitrobenzyl esterase
MARTLLQFMKTSDPNGGGRLTVPRWAQVFRGQGGTMVLDDNCEVMNDSNGEARKAQPVA